MERLILWLFLKTPSHCLQTLMRYSTSCCHRNYGGPLCCEYHSDTTSIISVCYHRISNAGQPLALFDIFLTHVSSSSLDVNKRIHVHLEVHYIKRHIYSYARFVIGRN